MSTHSTASSSRRNAGVGLSKCCVTPYIRVSLEAFVVSPYMLANIAKSCAALFFCSRSETSYIMWHLAWSLICRGLCTNFGQNLLALSASSALLSVEKQM